IESDRMELSEQGWRIIGHDPDAPPSMPLHGFLDGVPPLERERLLSLIDETLDGTGTIFIDTPYDTGRQEPASLVIEGEAERDLRGQIVGLVGVVHDVTRQRKLEWERAELEIRYRQAQKLESLGLVAGGINHDFNNILQQLLGLVNILAESSPTGTRDRDYLDMMRGTINRGSDSLRRLLAFSRQSLESSVVIDPCEVLAELVEDFRTRAPATVTLAYQCERVGDISLIADPGQLRHAVANLLQNALDAVGQRGTVTVTVSPAPPPDETAPKGESWTRIDVEDSGPGVPPTWRDRIFDPFFTTRQGQQGLGLSVAHGIVKAHGGELLLRTDRDRGACFSLLLPTTQSRPAVIPLPPPATRERPLRIFFLDDEELIVTTMVIMLKRFGVEAVGFTSPTAMLAAFEREVDTLDGVVTDLSMNECSGIDLARKIKRRHPSLPVVLCTGFSPDKDWSAEEREAVDAILYKPVGPEALVEALTGRPVKPKT
ncbi:MAG: response regulator, partial [Nitrospinae bacterium]|nr:response regulator [Nitrospinota bacterium]